MKGQTQAVTAVLITGIIVASVASAYIWGVPLIEKRQGQAEVDSFESKVFDLESGIRQVANGGQGVSSQIDFELNNGNIQVNSSENYIDVTTYASGVSYPIGSWRQLMGESRQGTSIGSGLYGFSGENTPGIVAVRRLSEANSVVTYRVEFRNIRSTTPSGPELRLIDIQSEGASEANGDVRMQFENLGTEEDTGSEGVNLNPDDPDSQTVDRTRNVVGVNLR